MDVAAAVATATTITRTNIHNKAITFPTTDRKRTLHAILHLRISSYTRITIRTFSHPTLDGKSLLFFFMPGPAFSLVVGNQDFFAGDFMIHSTFMLGCESHQCPVAKPGGDERVHIPDCKTMAQSVSGGPNIGHWWYLGGDLHVLACKRHTQIALINAICKARQWRCKAYDQSNHGTPICAEFGRIAVDAVEFVHVWYGNIATTGDVVAMDMLVM